MPALLNGDAATPNTEPALPFPPVTKSHILNCAYSSWFPKYRAITPKSRVIPLTKPFVDYLRADAIVLPDDEDPPTLSDNDSAYISSSTHDDDEEEEEEQEDVAAEWRQVHQAIRATIAELGGKVIPKLNWSAPKDATFMNANTMECKKPSDIYLLLKSSDFITHDLEHAFDDCVSESSDEEDMTTDNIAYHLALRKSFPSWVPSLEFRCFVRNRKLLCISQRDLNYYDFLFKMQDRIQTVINEFFEVRLRDTFPDKSFVFDCYIPQPYEKAWLVDINPWALRTDPILFSWEELLEMDEPVEPPMQEEFVRFSIDPAKTRQMLDHLRESNPEAWAALQRTEEDVGQLEDGEEATDSEDDDDADEELFLPELRLVHQGDPEAQFATPQYSAHKMPKDVVEASQNGEGLMEFAKEWRKHLERARQADAAASSSDDE
ncbi:uncharacterized protein MYCFIDRAFT_88305 [Pseudocercospora fijiensis CIRAD86]|uniref:Uncharacterized protein n=1 Tax=Pseudocercospora fijiensis (strain CIRAD86) TaxID=383855 RepID=M3ANN3_PSEFD|nr:uncharacterized protein MYCFIDRAFT_88305 [Pseudocercospora fijiensis CIRAD86]EME86201.1 hypothetical protein MYCFIDRAFT_88305 [Pseudocercospora fijiensis CIRAD86]